MCIRVLRGCGWGVGGEGEGRVGKGMRCDFPLSSEFCSSFFLSFFLLLVLLLPCICDAQHRILFCSGLSYSCQLLTKAFHKRNLPINTLPANESVSRYGGLKNTETLGKHSAVAFTPPLSDCS